MLDGLWQADNSFCDHCAVVLRDIVKNDCNLSFYIRFQEITTE